MSLPSSIGTRLRGRWMLGVSFLLSLSLWALVPPRIQSDGVGYYAYLRSAFFDHDLDFRNEYTHYRDVSGAIQFVDEQRLTPTGKVANVWAVGPGVLWSPFFLLGHLTARALVACGTRTALDGYSAPYVVAISFASCLYAWAGLLLAYRICREYMDRGTSCLALLVVWFGTSLPAYMYFYPSMGHATSFFSVSLFLFAWHTTRGQKTSIRWMLLGVLAGLMTMVRWQNCLFGIVAAFDLAAGLAGRIHKKNWKEAWMPVANGAGFLACAALAFSPQMLAWKSLYGQLLTFPFDPGGTSTHFHWMEHVSDVLFSSKHGLLTWTPAVSIALAGLPLFARKDKTFAVSLTVVFLLQLCLVGSWETWWQGASFGGRMFVECSTIFLLGLAAVMDRAKAKVPVRLLGFLCLLVVTWNLLLMFQYGVGLIPHEDYVSWRVVIRNQVLVVPKLLVKLVTSPGAVRLP